LLESFIYIQSQLIKDNLSNNYGEGSGIDQSILIISTIIKLIGLIFVVIVMYKSYKEYKKEIKYMMNNMETNKYSTKHSNRIRTLVIYKIIIKIFLGITFVSFLYGIWITQNDIESLFVLFLCTSLMIFLLVCIIYIIDYLFYLEKKKQDLD